MSTAILNELVNDIRNSIGNVVYSIRHGVPYTRTKPVAVADPNTPDQVNIRLRFKNAQLRWSSVLTINQHALWNDFAQSLGSASQSRTHQEGGRLVLIPDNRGRMSGYNAYVMLNCVAYSAGTKTLIQWIDDVPSSVSSPHPPTGLSVLCCQNGVGGFNAALLDWDLPVVLRGGERIRVWLACHSPAMHKQLVTTCLPGDAPIIVEQATGITGATIKLDMLPGPYRFQIDTVDIYGQKSPPSNTYEVVILNHFPSPCPQCPP